MNQNYTKLQIKLKVFTDIKEGFNEVKEARITVIVIDSL
jgi:hypothetical protein